MKTEIASDYQTAPSVCLLSFVPCVLLAPHSYRSCLFTELCPLSHPCCPRAIYWDLSLVLSLLPRAVYWSLSLVSSLLPTAVYWAELCPLSRPCCPQLGELGEAEDALMEANILNNSDPEVWGYLSLVCLRTARKVEAEQSYKHAVKVRLARRPAVPLVWGVKLEVEWNCCIWI